MFQYFFFQFKGAIFAAALDAMEPLKMRQTEYDR